MKVKNLNSMFRVGIRICGGQPILWVSLETIRAIVDYLKSAMDSVTVWILMISADQDSEAATTLCGWIYLLSMRTSLSMLLWAVAISYIATRRSTLTIKDGNNNLIMIKYYARTRNARMGPYEAWVEAGSSTYGRDFVCDRSLLFQPLLYSVQKWCFRESK